MIKKCLIYENKNFNKNMTDKDLESIEAKKPQIKKFKSLSKKDINIEINRNFVLNNIEEEIENDKEIKIKLNNCLDDLKILLENQEKLFKEIEHLKNEQNQIKLKKTEEPKDNKNYLKSPIKIYNFSKINDLGNNEDNINNMDVHNSLISFNQEDINQEMIKNNNYIKNTNLTTSIKIDNVIKK